MGIAAAVAQSPCTLVGDAMSLGGDCYQITPDEEWQLGAVWFNDQLDLNDPFTIQVDVELGSVDAAGADGIAFVMQSVGPAALGDAGGGLGFEGFNPSFGVEIDTWQNTDIGDPAVDHVAFLRDGINWHTAPYFNLAGPVAARSDGANIEDGQSHRFKLVWDPAAMLLEFYFDCELRLTLTEELVEEIFGGDSIVWWGFTGSTGGGSNLQSACITASAIGLAPEFNVCQGDSALLVLDMAQVGTVEWTPATGLSDPLSAVTHAAPAVSTLYTVTWTDVCDEQLTDSTWVEVAAIPAPDLPDSAWFCPGEEVNLTAAVPSGDAVVEWSDGTLTADWSGTLEGWQVVEVQTAAGCSASDSTWTAPLLPASFAFPSLPALCTGQDSLLAWPAGGADWTVNGVSMPAGWLATVGSAQIAFTDATTGCPLDTVFEVEEVVVLPSALPGTFAACEGESVTLMLDCDPASEVIWSPATGLSSDNVPQPIAGPAATTTYVATVSDVCGQVTEWATTVEVVELPLLTLPDSIAACEGEAVTLSLGSLSGAPIVEWSDGTLGADWTGQEGGWQSVTVDYLPGCFAEDSTFVDLLVPEVPTFEVSPLCPGAMDFVAFPAGWDQWGVPGLAEVGGGWNVVAPGTFTGTAVEVATGCPVPVYVEVPQGVLPAMSLPEEAYLCDGDLLHLHTGIAGEVVWSDGEVGSIREVTETGWYVAEHLSACGVVRDSTEVIEAVCGCPVFVPSAFTPDSDGMNEAWRPEMDCELLEYHVQVFNRWGEQVWDSQVPGEYWVGGSRKPGSTEPGADYFGPDGLYRFVLTYRVPFRQASKRYQTAGDVWVFR